MSTNGETEFPKMETVLERMSSEGRAIVLAWTASHLAALHEFSQRVELEFDRLGLGAAEKKGARLALKAWADTQEKIMDTVRRFPLAT